MTDAVATQKLDSIFRPGQPLPPDAVMISVALNILNHSPHGQQLVECVKEENISIKIMATPQPTTYLPDTRQVYIGFNRNNPVTPSRFILMMAGILREALQEISGFKLPSLGAPAQEHVEISMAKHEDKIWCLCKIATELNDLETFTEYNFPEELKKMGHAESLDLFLKQQNKNS